MHVVVEASRLVIALPGSVISNLNLIDELSTTMPGID